MNVPRGGAKLAPRSEQGVYTDFTREESWAKRWPWWRPPMPKVCEEYWATGKCSCRNPVLMDVHGEKPWHLSQEMGKFMRGTNEWNAGLCMHYLWKGKCNRAGCTFKHLPELELKKCLEECLRCDDECVQAVGAGEETDLVEARTGLLAKVASSQGIWSGASV